VLVSAIWLTLQHWISTLISAKRRNSQHSIYAHVCNKWISRLLLFAESQITHMGSTYRFIRSLLQIQHRFPFLLFSMNSHMISCVRRTQQKKNRERERAMLKRSLIREGKCGLYEFVQYNEQQDWGGCIARERSKSKHCASSSVLRQHQETQICYNAIDVAFLRFYWIAKMLFHKKSCVTKASFGPHSPNYT
jgi:hypothetical protein